MAYLITYNSGSFPNGPSRLVKDEQELADALQVPGARAVRVWCNADTMRACGLEPAETAAAALAGNLSKSHGS
jgi:hypothetical protein